MADDGMVIVGASLAGAKAAEGARAAGWKGPIRLVGSEPHLPYERPPLSKSILLGTDGPVTALVHDPGWEVAEDVDLLLGAVVERVDLADRTVEVGGRTLRFSRLVLATGSSPRVVDLPGHDLPEVLYLRTIEDALALRERMLPGRRLAVVGASWIGTEVTACARQRGSEVVMVEPLSTPLERVLGPEVGRFFASLHAQHGVELRLGIGADAIIGAAHVEGVRLGDGSVVPADTVVIGIGVTPNVALAREAGLEVEHGVLVDASLTTSHPDVLAAGDIAEADHPLVDQRVRVEHWANALNSGPAAARSMLGQDVSYDPVPYFFSDQYDLGMETAGLPEPGTYDQVLYRGDRPGREFIAFWLAGGAVVAGMNVNVWDVSDDIQALIRSGKKVDPARLTDSGIPIAEV